MDMIIRIVRQEDSPRLCRNGCWVLGALGSSCSPTLLIYSSSLSSSAIPSLHGIQFSF